MYMRTNVVSLGSRGYGLRSVAFFRSGRLIATSSNPRSIPRMYGVYPALVDDMIRNSYKELIPYISPYTNNLED